MLKVLTFTLGELQTNCYLAYDNDTKEAILIDPAVFDKKISDYIKRNNINVRFTVNTHGHYDHIGGDKDFGYPLLIHKDDEVFLKDPVRNLFITLNGNNYSAPEVLRTLDDKDVIKIKNISFKVIHTPGHTPGGISLECDNVLFTGDTLFFEGVGRTDLPFADGDDLKKSIKRLMQYNDEVIIYPGHGPLSTIGHERRCNPFYA